MLSRGAFAWRNFTFARFPLTDACTEPSLNHCRFGLPSIHASKRISGGAMARELENFTLVHLDASSRVVGSLEE